MMKICVLLLTFLWFQSILCQKLISIETIKGKLISNFSPILVSDDYAISININSTGGYFLSEFARLTNENIRYSDKFELYKHDFGSEKKNQKFSFSINKKNQLKRYLCWENDLYLISSQKTNEAYFYYLDIIDLGSFEHKVKNKSIIEYKHNPKHSLLLFESDNNGNLYTVFKKDKLENEKLVLEFFFITNLKISNYYTLSLPSSNHYYKKYSFSRSNKGLQLIFNDKVDSDSRNIKVIPFIQFTKDKMELDSFNFSSNDYLLSSKLLNDSVLFSVMTSNRAYFYPSKIIFATLGGIQKEINLPKEFSDHFKRLTRYRFRLNTINADKGIFMIESMKINRVSNNHTQYNYFSFGPSILFKLDATSMRLIWSQIFYNRRNYYYNSGDVEMCAFELGDYCYVFYSKTSKQLSINRVNTMTGELKNISENSLSSKQKQAFVYRAGVSLNNKKALILLYKGRKILPIGISEG